MFRDLIIGSSADTIKYCNIPPSDRTAEKPASKLGFRKGHRGASARGAEEEDMPPLEQAECS